MAAISATVAGTIGTAVLLGAGATAATIQAKKARDKEREKGKGIGGLESVPTIETAEELAIAEAKRRSKIRKRTGGETVLTQKVPQTAGAGKTFLGE